MSETAAIAQQPAPRAATPVRAPVPRSAVLRKRTAIVARWLHIYLSMVSFAVVLFFAATGFTLNHAEKLGGHDRVARFTGTVPANVMAASGGPDKLQIAEQLRHEHNIHGMVTDTRTEDDQVSLSFKGPGYTADAFIDRPSGHYQLIETRSNAVSVLNDLHRGASTGKVWSAVIDASAILLVLVSLTGLVLIFFVYKRRTSGLLLAAIAAAVVVLIFRLVVP